MKAIDVSTDTLCHVHCTQAGLDSLGAVELRNAIAAAFNIQLPMTITFDYPTVAALAGFLASKLVSTGTHHGVTILADDLSYLVGELDTLSRMTNVVGISLRYPAAEVGGER